MTGGITALVLAGSRAGRQDPVALAGGTSHKALVSIAGQPMLWHVLRTLRACPQVGEVVVCAQNASLLLKGLDGAEGIVAREGQSGPSRSVGAMMAEFGTPLLVTTADHPLLTPAMVAHFLANVAPAADVVAAIADAATVRAALPDTKRTWLRFSNGSYSGCNLFLLATPAASGPIGFWERLERDRKRPLALARMLGLGSLILYALRVASLDGMLRRLERLTGATLAIVEMPFAEAAVDVDKPEDLVLVETILAQRQAA